MIYGRRRLNAYHIDKNFFTKSMIIRSKQIIKNMSRLELIRVLNKKVADLINQWLQKNDTNVQITKNPFSDFQYDFFPIDPGFDGCFLSNSFQDSTIGKQFKADGIGFYFCSKAVYIGTAHLTTRIL